MKRYHSIRSIWLILGVFLFSCSATGSSEASQLLNFVEATNELSATITLPIDAEQASPSSIGLLQPTPTIYLPMVTKNYPHITVFGVQISGNLSHLEGSNISWVRTRELRWDIVQPNPQEGYQWSSDQISLLEQQLRQARSLGMTPILVINRAPEWARKYPQSGCGPIKSDALSDFAAFVSEVVKRYSAPEFNINYYQIWNEPDAPVSDSNVGFGCWGEQTDPYFGGEYYGQMLNIVYPAIKAANPNAQVVTGGLLLGCDPRGTGKGFCANQDLANQWNFFEGVVKTGGNSFDLVAIHTYAYYGETGSQNSPVYKERQREGWSANGGVVDGKINYIREKMSLYGVNKPIIITEAALLYSDSPFPDDQTRQDYESQKADYLVWLYANTWSQGVKGVTWYAFEGWRKTELVREGQELPAFHALKTMTGFLKNADYLNREDNDGYTKFVYRNGNEIIWLLVPTGQVYGQQYSIPVPPKLKRVVDIFGNEQGAVGSNIAFTRPTYVFLNP